MHIPTNDNFTACLIKNKDTYIQIDYKELIFFIDEWIVIQER